MEFLIIRHFDKTSHQSLASTPGQVNLHYADMSAIQKINNIIYKKVPVGQFVRSNGEKIVLSVATETELWKRPVEVAVEHGPALERAVKDNLDKIDDNVKEITSRYANKLLLSTVSRY